MPIAVNADDQTPLARIRERLTPGLPVIVMIHGFRYTPARPAADPHSILFAPHAWPGQLHGQTVGFGWDACGTIWQARANAARTGLALARLIAGLDAPVGIIAHSLGARVALSALTHLPQGAVQRMVLLAGAEYGDAALAALDGKGTEVLNVTSRENDGYDFLYETLTAPLSGRRTLAALHSRPGIATVQIDCDDHRAGLARLGFPTDAPDRRICHWSCYSRPGLFPLYRRFLTRPETLPISALHAALPRTLAPRWSRLLGGVRTGDGGQTALGSGA